MHSDIFSDFNCAMELARLCYNSDTKSGVKNVTYLNDTKRFYKKLNDNQKHDINFIRKCAISNGKIIKYIKEEFQCDKEIVLNAIKNNSKNIIFCNDKMKNNNELMLIAIKNDAKNILYVSSNLKNNYKFVLDAIEINEKC